MFLKTFAKDNEAVAAIEFAFIAPILVMLYLGLAELTTGMIAQREVAHAGAAVGDLTAQTSAVTPAELTDLFDAGAAIVAPFSVTPLQQRVSSITADSSGNTTVDWSQGSGMTAYTPGASITMPAGSISANQSVIMSEVSYIYSSPISYFLPAPITFANTFFFTPRNSNNVTCTGCPTAPPPADTP